MELVVFITALKFFFIEGGEQFVVGIQTAKKIGLNPTIKITLAGISFAITLFFLLFYSHTLIPSRWLELALAITLYFFAARMFKEAFEDTDEEKEVEVMAFKYGYITVVSLESVENATALAALAFIDISGALAGAAISIAVFVVIALRSGRFIARMPLDKLKLISGALLATTATPLAIYSSGIVAPGWLYWITPPLK
jgi:uncharacterized membrane protein